MNATTITRPLSTTRLAHLLTLALLLVFSVLPVANMTTQVNAAATNLAPNPSFEVLCGEVPCNWRPNSPGEHTTTSSTIAHTGDRSLLLSYISSGAPGLRSDCISGISGSTQYNGAFYYLLPPGSPVSRISLNAIVYSGSSCNSFVTNSQVTLINTQRDGQWHKVTGSYITPSNAQSIQLALTSFGGGVTNYDDVFFGTDPVPSTCPAITLRPTSLPDGVVGDSYNQSLTASDGTSPYSFAVTSGTLPGGLALGSSGTLSGTPSGASNSTFTITVTDANGCTASQSYTLTTLIVDNTPPVITPTVNGTAGNNDWYTSDVNMSWTVNDPESAISSTSGCDELVISTDTDGTTLTCTATSLGGTSKQPVTIKRDTTKPTITAAATSAPNANGWYTSAVTIHFTCTDDGSGIPASACPADQVLSTDGTAVASTAQTVTDAAGNSATSNVVTVKIDMTAPTLQPVVSPNPVLLGGSATATPNASDATSGVASQSCGAMDTSSVGTKTVSCTATDAAGNTTSASASYQVIYAFKGFFQPIDAAPTVNVVKAGSAVPVKFSLTGNQGLSIFASGSPASQKVTCASGAPVDDIEQTVTAGSSSLQYDAASDTYLDVWKTDKAWTSTCRQLTVTLADGTVHTAQFRFK